MKQKLRNLSAPANIIFAILAVFIFIAPLQWSGKVLGLIPGMEKADDYLLQAIVETVVLVIFLGITYIFGLWDIFKENAAGFGFCRNCLRSFCQNRAVTADHKCST